MTLSLLPSTNDLAYDFLLWIVANGLGAGSVPLFIDGETSSDEQQDDTVHLLLAYSDDAPDDAIIVTVSDDNEVEPAVPVRSADFSLLVRAAERSTGGSRARASAISKAVQELLRDSDRRNKAHFELPSGRRVLSITEISDAWAGVDGAQRNQYLLQFRVLYIDPLRQTT
jgi:hypothetical protein